MYENAIKNKDKPEFNWETNSSCIDFHLIIDGKSNYYYSGSYCDGTFEFYNEIHDNEEMAEYDIDEFKTLSKQLVIRFLNRKNKKEYSVDELLDSVPIKIWNELEDHVDELKLSLFLTYCP